MAAPSLVKPPKTSPAHLTGDLDLSAEALMRVLDMASLVKRTPARFAQAPTPKWYPAKATTEPIC